MIYIGIDIAKTNHFATAIDSDGVVLFEPFEFLNDNDGFFMFLSKISDFEKDNIIIGMESTAHYGNNLMFFLISKSFNVCLFNPIQTASLRKTKTDKIDSLLVAKTVALMGNPLFVTLYDISLTNLKN